METFANRLAEISKSCMSLEIKRFSHGMRWYDKDPMTIIVQCLFVNNFFKPVQIEKSSPALVKSQCKIVGRCIFSNWMLISNQSRHLNEQNRSEYQIIDWKCFHFKHYLKYMEESQKNIYQRKLMPYLIKVKARARSSDICLALEDQLSTLFWK